MDRLRWFMNQSTADKLRYIGKTLKDMDNALLYKKDLPTDWYNQHGSSNYLTFLNKAQDLLKEIADHMDKEKS